MAFPKQLILVYLTVFIDAIGFSFVLPTLPYIISELGGSATEVGYTASIYALTQAISAVGMGSLSDKGGRKPYFVLSLIGSFLGPLFQAFSPNLPLFIVSRAFTGILGGSQTIGQAYIADSIAPEERSKYLTQSTAIVAVSFVIGPLLGGVLTAISLRFPYYAASICAFVVLILVIFILKETNQNVILKKQLTKERKQILKKTGLSDAEGERLNEINNKLKNLTTSSKNEKKQKVKMDLGIWTGIIQRFLNDSACCIFSSMYGQFIMEKLGGTSVDYSLIFGTTGVFTLLTQLLLFPLLHNKCHLSYMGISIIGGLINAAGYFMMAYIHVLWCSYISASVMFIGFSFLCPISPSLLSIHGPKDNQGGVLSLGVLAGQIAMIIVPTVEGYIYSASPVACFVSGAAFGILIALQAAITLCIPGGKDIEKPVFADEYKDKDEKTIDTSDAEKAIATSPSKTATENEVQAIPVVTVVDTPSPNTNAISPVVSSSTETNQ
ncbi:hypothetical protein WA158_004310 [Blastocystis sp. Blastoise]